MTYVKRMIRNFCIIAVKLVVPFDGNEKDFERLLKHLNK